MTEHHGSHTFTGHGAAEPVALNGIAGKAERRHTSAAVTAVLKDASSDNWTLYGAAFHVPHHELAAVLADPGKLADFAYSVLFRAGEPGIDLSWGGTGPGGPDMKVEPATKAHLHHVLFTAIAAQYDPPPPPKGGGPAETEAQKAEREARRKALGKDLGVALDAEFHGATFEGYHAHWDNSDDTTIEGALAIHAATGEVRAVVAWAPA